MKSCVVCSKDNSAYKCPKCRLFYCSKECCAQHKASGCAESQSQPTNPVISKDKKEATSSERFVTLLTEDQKHKLQTNPMISKLMKSKRLRKDFEVVDSAPNRHEALKQLRMQNPEFEEVMNLLLATISSST